jgi:hypothetical protein
MNVSMPRIIPSAEYACECMLYPLLQSYYTAARSRDSSVGIATGWVAGLDSRKVQEIFHFSTGSRPALGPAQPPTQWVPGILSPGE